ncbi:MAG: AI-2E family transporter [Candidatus Hydrogenedentes bacterium]|nr:AI-2E family transporter [Candidatus Hydrogenedentota bacterium]
MLQPVFQNPWVRAVGALLAIAAVIMLAYILRPVLVPLFLALTVAYVLDPVVDFFEAKRIPRMLTILCLGVIASIIALSIPLVIIPSVYQQATGLIASGKGMPQFSSIDVSRDGFLSRGELAITGIAIDEAAFSANDADADNVLSAEEAAPLLGRDGGRGEALLDWLLDRLPVNAMVRMLNLDKARDAGAPAVLAQPEQPIESAAPAEEAAEPSAPSEATAPAMPGEVETESETEPEAAPEIAATPVPEDDIDARALLAEYIGTNVRDFAVQFAKTHAGSLASFGQQAGMNVFGFIRSLGQALLNVVLFLANFALFAVVAGYLLKGFDPLKANARKLIPPRYAPKTLAILGDIDDQLRSFLRGQMTVCMCLSLFYTIGFLIFGVPFAIPIGAFALVVSFIPFVGVFVIAVIAILLTLLQYGIDYHIFGVIFWVILAQFLEGNFLTPKIVGDKVGLNPVWVILAIMVFGNFLGFLGLLLAVPIAAALKVLVVEGVAYYKASPLFEGVEPEDDSEPPADAAPRRKKRR